jgi:hypothetical protein
LHFLPFVSTLLPHTFKLLKFHMQLVTRVYSIEIQLNFKKF